MGFLSCIKEDKKCVFIGGIVAGLILPSLAKSKTARKAAVNLTAKGMGLRENAVTAYESIKEDAQDVYSEAKRKASEGDGPTE